MRQAVCGARGRSYGLGVWVCWLLLVLSAAPVRAAALDGELELQRDLLYRLDGLRAGQSVTLTLQASGGSLDPWIGVLRPEVDTAALLHDYLPEVERLRVHSRDRPEAFARLAERFFLASNDDAGDGGYGARLRFTAPADGDYRLLVASTPLRPSVGGFRLEATAEGAAPQLSFLQPVGVGSERVQSLDARLDPAHALRLYELQRINRGETLSVRLEADGDWLPQLTLYDFGDKPLASVSATGKGQALVLHHTFGARDDNPRLRIRAQPVDGRVAAGAYHLSLGINAAEVEQGRVSARGPAVLREPLAVSIGLKLHQITGVDQRAENYGIVASLMLDWSDPALAFNPQECDCRQRVFVGDSFAQYVASLHARWPEFIFANQQGNRWSQRRVVVLQPDGHATYFERASLTLQAPDFDFRRFPFDQQKFFVRIEALWPEWLYHFTELPGFTEVGGALGEEEWVLTHHTSAIDSVSDSTGLPVSRYNFGFVAERHLNYYISRIFLPILIIIIVSWVTFFLRDYGKRVDVAGGNLLLFIAFSFTISGDLPRLGYLTLMDILLISTFVVTGLMLVLSVYLRRQEADGHLARIQRIDRLVLAFYPLAYLLAMAGVMLIDY